MTTDSINIREMHREAMNIAQKAFIAKNNGDNEQALLLYYQAYKLEKEAALGLLKYEDKEPTRSILFRSAASLAKNCGEFRESEKMVAYGLSGNPPSEIAEELRILYDEVNFQRHLNSKGIQLDDDEVFLSLHGNEVGYGTIRSEEFLNRFKVIEQLTYRTAERKAGKPYRKNGNVPADVKLQFEPYIATPIAASFAVRIKFGKPTPQLSLFNEKNVYRDVIDEVLADIELINNSKTDELKNKINNEDYFQNFVSLTKALSPDGDKIKQVGFKIIRGTEEKIISLHKYTRSQEVNTQFKEKSKKQKEIITVTGTLRMADADKNIIRLLTSENSKAYSIKVPNGLTDIVRLYWEDTVIVTIELTQLNSGKLIEITNS